MSLYVTYFKSDSVLFPATSTAMECVFSQGRQLLQFTWNWLSGNSIRALLCFSDWCQKDLVDAHDILKAIRYSSKGKHKWGLSDETNE